MCVGVCVMSMVCVCVCGGGDVSGGGGGGGVMSVVCVGGGMSGGGGGFKCVYEDVCVCLYNGLLHHWSLSYYYMFLCIYCLLMNTSCDSKKHKVVTCSLLSFFHSPHAPPPPPPQHTHTHTHTHLHQTPVLSF